MALSPAVVDYIIITVFEMLRVLVKHQKGEVITNEELKLEKWDETLQRLKKLNDNENA